MLVRGEIVRAIEAKPTSVQFVRGHELQGSKPKRPQGEVVSETRDKKASVVSASVGGANRLRLCSSSLRWRLARGGASVKARLRCSRVLPQTQPVCVCAAERESDRPDRRRRAPD